MAAGAQDIHFSQFFENPTLRNPALTGIFSGDYKASANYRNQWNSFGSPYQTALVSGETKALLRESTKDYLSFGASLIYDKAGSVDLTSIAAVGAANYNKALGDDRHTYLSVGLSAGYIQRSVDQSKMRFANQFTNGSFSTYNPSGENMGVTSISHFDATAGVSLSGSFTPQINYYAGISAYHVSKPKETYFEDAMIRLSTRWSGNFGIAANLGNGFGLTMHTNYQYQQPYQEFITGAMVNHSFHTKDGATKIMFYAGCYYRNKDAIIPMVKMEYSNYSLTASYDIATQSKRMYIAGIGSYELSLSIKGEYYHKEPSRLACPRFEILDTEDSPEW
jgi:type IX secretion system PorP/SprF family membrane protein